MPRYQPKPAPKSNMNTNTTTPSNRKKLNQIIAVETGLKKRCEDAFTELYRDIQKPTLFSGSVRTYESKTDDEDLDIPDTPVVLVQERVWRKNERITQVLQELLSTILTKEDGNHNPEARASVVINGVTLIENAPVTFLLQAEKKIVDIRTYVSKLPTLSATTRWRYDANLDLYESEVQEKTRTRKITRYHTVAPATDKHPAQVKEAVQDVPIGTFKDYQHSGAVPESVKMLMLERVNQVIDAIKEAREKANSIEIETKNMSAALFDFILSPSNPQAA